MKISVSSYSLCRLLDENTTNLDLMDISKRIGLDAIEFTDLPGEGEERISNAKAILQKSKEINLPICAYTVFADFLNGSDGDIDKEIARVKEQVDIAEILGVKVMRHDATGGYKSKEDRTYKGFDDALPRLVKGCRAVTEYAATKGIKTMVENHGFFSQDSLRVEKLVNTVANENFGALVDIGNFLCADEDPVTAVGRMAPYAFHAHVKDFYVRSGNGINPGDGFFMSRGGNYLRGAIAGQGDVPVLQCLRALKRSGYDGYISIEFEGLEDPQLGVKIGHDNLRRIIEML